MEMIGWLAAFIIFILIEGATMALTTIWFAGGAGIAFFAAAFHMPLKGQAVVFLAVSFVLLIFTRPFALKYVNRGAVRTNSEGLVGKKARVTAEINNDLSSGAAVLNGQEWTARAAKEGVIIPVGEIVVVCAIRGVKLVVEPIPACVQESKE
ncbi:MAG: NfeD family protein [Lachnospiraceae bacterium]|nr:NfeD family protein [Lachnospiraceae bacterium]